MRNKIQETGFVSIIVAALLMIIVSLITVGFTRIMQREQRQAIDRQLSSTALYAAESGINDVIAAIKDGDNFGPNADYRGVSKDACDVTGLGPYDNGNLISATDDSIAYTCALYDQTPGALDYELGSDGESKIVQLKTTSGEAFKSLTVSWGGASTNDVSMLQSCAAAFDHPADSTSRGDAPPILRLDLTSVTGGNYNRTRLLDNTDYMFLIPCDSSGTASHDFSTSTRGTRGNAIPVPCDNVGDRPCSVTITDINGVAASDILLARVRALYGGADVTVAGVDAVDDPIAFEGAQIGIDMTARANDVVRRLRVSVPFENDIDVPEVALQLFDGFCKRLNVINDDPLAGAIDIIDECISPPAPDPPVTVCRLSPLPQEVVTVLQSVVDANPTAYGPPSACPTSTGGCGSSPTFALADYAETLFPVPPNSYTDRYSAIDVLYDPTRNFNARKSRPDFPVGGATGTSGVRIDPSCVYEADYTSQCGANLFPTGDSDWDDPVASCGGVFDQPYEAIRVWLYSGPTTISDPQTLQCGGDKLAYFDTADNSTVSTEWVAASPVNIVTTTAADVHCVELEHVCSASGPAAGLPGTCTFPDPFVTFSSVFLHSFGWQVVP